MGEVRHRLPCHETRGDRGDGGICCLGHERHGARGAGVHLDQIHLVVLDRELHVHQADNAKGQRQCFGLFVNLVDDVPGQGVGGQRTGAVAGMHTRFLDMLHQARYMHGLAIAERVHIHFHGT